MQCRIIIIIAELSLITCNLLHVLLPAELILNTELIIVMKGNIPVNRFVRKPIYTLWGRWLQSALESGCTRTYRWWSYRQHLFTVLYEWSFGAFYERACIDREIFKLVMITIFLKLLFAIAANHAVWVQVRNVYIYSLNPTFTIIFFSCLYAICSLNP